MANISESDWHFLDALRSELTSIDSELQALLSKRREVSAKIAKVKHDLGLPLRDTFSVRVAKTRIWVSQCVQ